MSTWIKFSIVAATALVWTAVTQAVVQPIVGFTNSQIVNAVNFPAVTNYGQYGGGGADDERYVTAYSDSTPLLATGAGGYTGQNIYGGRVRTQFDVTNSMYNYLNNANSGPGLNFRIYSNTNCLYQIASVHLVKKADFASNGDTMPANFTNGCEFTVYYNNEGNRSGKIRAVVQIGTQKYISEYSEGFPAVTYTSILTHDELQALGWAPYDPAAGVFFDSTSATFSPMTLTNIQAAGIWFGENHTTAEVNNYHWKIFRMDVTADVVPEPGVMALGGLALLAILRRK